MRGLNSLEIGIFNTEWGMRRSGWGTGKSEATDKIVGLLICQNSIIVAIINIALKIYSIYCIIFTVVAKACSLLCICYTFYRECSVMQTRSKLRWSVMWETLCSLCYGQLCIWTYYNQEVSIALWWVSSTENVICGICQHHLCFWWHYTMFTSAPMKNTKQNWGLF